MSKKEYEVRVCPVELSGSLDNRIRKWLQNPQKILNPYIKPGMTVLDLGCGPGFFSIEIARMLQGSGQVIAADLQQGMLDKVSQKISGTALEQSIRLHRCSADSINLSEKVGFVLMFYVVHEVPDQVKLFKELKTILNPDGRILIVEPNFHVTKKAFDDMLDKTKDAGFEVFDRPGFFFSRAVVLANNWNCSLTREVATSF